MTEIVLKKMTMCNFKGCALRTTEFNSDITTISGKNGLGKSRHADAFFWCLTGKDAADRKDYEIKTHAADGKTLQKADASVELTFAINGKEIRFRRVLVEKWETPKGQIEEVYRGNKTECYIDDVPVPVKEYELRLAEIITPEMLKLVTNPLYFAEVMDWKGRREILMNMVDVTTEEAAADNADLQLLLEDMSGKTEDDFRRWLQTQINALKDKPAENEIRIRQIMEDMSAQDDWEAIQENIKAEQDRLEMLQLRLNDASEGNGQYIAKKYELEGEIRKLQDTKREIKAQKQREADAAYAKELADYKANKLRVTEANTTITAFEKNIEGNKVSIEKAEQTIATASEEKTKLAEQYEQLKSGEGVCPLCGGTMTDELAGKLLPDVVKKIDNCNTIIEHTTKVADALRDSNAGLQRQIDEAKATVEELGQLQEPQISRISEENIAEVQSLNEQIKRAQEALDSLTGGFDNTRVNELKREVAECNQHIAAFHTRLAAKSRIDELGARIEELKAETAAIVAERAKLERMAAALMRLQQRKADILQERIDKMFTLVSFKMFDFTIEGNPVECCTPMINGVPYGSANRAARLNAGLDIINVLSKQFGYVAPIWIDNAEAVNDILPTASQQIRLEVSEEDELTVK